MKLYAVSSTNFSTVLSTETQKDVKVQKVLEKAGISVPAGGETAADLGSVEFRSKTSSTATTIWFDGVVYVGYAVEVYIGDTLSTVKFNGDSSVRRAYQDYLKKNN